MQKPVYKIALLVSRPSIRFWVYRLAQLLQERFPVEIIWITHRHARDGSRDNLTIAAKKLEKSVFLCQPPVLAQRCSKLASVKAIAGHELLTDLSVDLILNLSQQALDFATYPPSCPVLCPLYHTSPEEEGLIQAILSPSTVPFLAVTQQDDTILTSSLVAIPDRSLLLQALESCFARLISLFLRAVDHLLYGRSLAQPLPAPTTPPPDTSRLFALGRSYGNRVIDMVRRRFLRDDYWYVAFWQMTSGTKAATLAAAEPAYQVVPTGSDRFYADPFLFEHRGQLVLFVEEYRYTDPNKKGIISCLQWDGKAFTNPRVVLERPYHLSYPFVFEADGEIYMIPETSQNRTVELYRATHFPDQWELDTVLLDNLCAVDATLHFHEDRWWMFTNIAECGASSWDELAIFYADHFKGPWVPHPMNPVKSDARSARPAGKLFYHQGRLLRPAQDCSKGYGGSVVLCEVTRLTPDQYEETVIQTLTPDLLPSSSHGLHTLNRSQGFVVLDGKTVIPKPQFQIRNRPWVIGRRPATTLPRSRYNQAKWQSLIG